MIKNIVVRNNIYGNGKIIFTVILPNREPVFMSIDVSDYKRNNSGIVIVDARRFLELWRNEPFSIHSEISHGDPDVWPSFRKYPNAEKGFSFGSENPVPLAYVAYGNDERIIVNYKFLWFGRRVSRERFDYIGFINGITRTIWLLTQGCSAFPIECEMPGARELYNVAGYSGTSFYTVGELEKIVTDANCF